MNFPWRQTLKRRRLTRKVALDRILQCGFFANSPYRAAPCVHVSRAGGTSQQLHPSHKIGVRRESVAARKDCAQAVGRTSHQFVEECLLLAVNVGEEGEIQRMVADGEPVDAQISDGLIVEDRKRAKCSVSNCANGTSGLFGLTDPSRLIHGVEQARAVPSRATERSAPRS